MKTVRLHMQPLQTALQLLGGRGIGLGTCNRKTKHIINM